MIGKMLLLGLLLLAMPSALSLRLAISPDVLFFNIERSALAFTLVNPNSEPVTLGLRVVDHPELFQLTEELVDLGPRESRRVQVYLNRPLPVPYVEDTILASIEDHSHPLALTPGVGVKLSAIGEAIKMEEPISERPRHIIKKKVKGNPMVSGGLYAIVVLIVVSGSVFSFRRWG